MRNVTERSQVDVREYRDDDEEEVLALLARALGPGPAGARTSEFWRWKHVTNPFGRSFVLVARIDGAIVGVRPFMRWGFHAGGKTYTSVRAVDTATDPDHQGKGIFSKLTRAALDALREEIDFVFNTPNDKSGPGYLKLGWSEVGNVPIRVRVKNPLRFAKGLRSIGHSDGREPVATTTEATSAADILSDAAAVERAIARSTEPEGRFATPRSAPYLRWRYAQASFFDYRAIQLPQDRGFAIFRVRSRGSLREAVVTEVVVPAGDIAAAASLLRRVSQASHVDHVAAAFPSGTAARNAMTRTAFLPAPGGMHLVVNTLDRSMTPDPTQLGSWALSLGDLEMF